MALFYVSARAMVDKVRSDINSQNQTLADAKKELKEKELKALAFKPEAEKRQEDKSRDNVWLTKQDLEHSNDINIVGLRKTGSYNHDRYGSKPPTHNYSLIGDVLTKGNEFGQQQKYDPDSTLLALNKSDNNNIGAIRMGWNPPVDPDKECPIKPRSAVELPPNIRHRFGSRVCDSLLSDEKKVTETLDKQKRDSRASKLHPEVDTKDYDVRASSSYFGVSQATRFNVFPGHSMLDMDSTMRSTHNDVVYLRREPMVEKYRMVKDDYGENKLLSSFCLMCCAVWCVL